MHIHIYNLYGTVSGLGKKVYRGIDRGMKFMDSKPVKAIVGGLDSLIPNNDIRKNYMKMKNYGGAMQNKVGDFNGTIKKYGNIGSDMMQAYQKVGRDKGRGDYDEEKRGGRYKDRNQQSLQREKPVKDETYLGGLFDDNN